MNPWTSRRAATSAALMVSFGRERGLDAETLLAGTGLGEEQITDPGGEITDDLELAVIANLVEALDDRPGEGFALGLRYQAAVHGIFGYALMSCATVRDGIEVGTRFFDLTFAFSRAALEYAGDEVRFCLDDRHVPAHLRGFLLERDVSGILAHWGALWGQPSEVRRIEVAESLGERVPPVFRDRGFWVETTASTHAVVVDARALDRPMPTASPEAAAVLLRECVELLQRRQNHGELGARVREVLLRRAAEGPTQDQVAAELGSSVRTLRRQLGEEGTSYRAIVAETLGAMAGELLDAGLPVERVAHRLGYADASSFSVAFKRWTGRTPGGRRRERRSV
ncbi:helix-turn-helix domain-containing protein [Rhodococcus rhodochrous]|uniref:AraC family transcriptional regulator ligand-binding domain-containing protein n=1 Tax=Rhodococcus rhodochrous TaxID=1829 RepID=UPI0013207466|nr:helix-turn-helix domain-containing protein [Rhodococcus rhodochrous]